MVFGSAGGQALAVRPWRSGPGGQALAVRPWRSGPGGQALAVRPWRSGPSCALSLPGATLTLT